MSHLWVLDLWAYNAFLVGHCLPHVSQVWTATFMCLASIWLRTWCFCAPLYWQTKQTNSEDEILSKYCISSSCKPGEPMLYIFCGSIKRDQTIACWNQLIYFIGVLMLIPRLMDTECVPSFANLGTHWTEVSLTGHMVHLYVVPQVGLVLGSKPTITTAPSACRRIFEDLSINQGCKEKLFMQE